MGLFMYILTVAMLYARGFYNIHKKQKNIFTIIIFILLNLSQMRFGSKIFLNSLICCVSCQEKKAGKIIRQFTNSYILG